MSCLFLKTNMGLEDIPDVKIDHYRFSKFVLVKGPDNRHYIHGVYFLARHEGLYDDFIEKVRCMDIDSSLFSGAGGGLLDWDLSKKELRAYDESVDLGKFNVDIVRQLLLNYVGRTPKLQGFSVKVD